MSETDRSLIWIISDTPSINWQIKVLDGGVQPDPVFSVFQSFKNKNDARLFSGLQ